MIVWSATREDITATVLEDTDSHGYTMFHVVLTRPGEIIPAIGTTETTTEFNHLFDDLPTYGDKNIAIGAALEALKAITA